MVMLICIKQHLGHIWSSIPEKVKHTKAELKKSVAYTEAATGGVLQKKVFLKVSQNSQENTCARVSYLIKLQAPPANF